MHIIHEKSQEEDGKIRRRKGTRVTKTGAVSFTLFVTSGRHIWP